MFLIEKSQETGEIRSCFPQKARASAGALGCFCKEKSAHRAACVRIVEYRILFVSNKKKVVTHAQEFRLLADVEVVPQVLLIGSIIQTIDEILQQFTCTIRCNLVTDLYVGFAK